MFEVSLADGNGTRPAVATHGEPIWTRVYRTETAGGGSSHAQGPILATSHTNGLAQADNMNSTANNMNKGHGITNSNLNNTLSEPLSGGPTTRQAPTNGYGTVPGPTEQIALSLIQHAALIAASSVSNRNVAASPGPLPQGPVGPPIVPSPSRLTSQQTESAAGRVFIKEEPLILRSTSSSNLLSRAVSSTTSSLSLLPPGPLPPSNIDLTGSNQSNEMDTAAGPMFSYGNSTPQSAGVPLGHALMIDFIKSGPLDNE